MFSFGDPTVPGMPTARVDYGEQRRVISVDFSAGMEPVIHLRLPCMWFTIVFLLGQIEIPLGLMRFMAELIG